MTDEKVELQRLQPPSQGQTKMSSPENNSVKTLDTTLINFRDLEEAKNRLNVKISQFSTLLAIIVFICIVLTFIDIEMTKELVTNYKNETCDQYEDDLSSNAYKITTLVTKSCLSVLSIVLLVILYMDYSCQCQMMILRNLLPENASVMSTPSLRNTFLIEFVLCLLHVPPVVAEMCKLPYQLQLIVFIRIYLLWRYVKEHNKYAHNKATKLLASVTKTELTKTFILKTILITAPFQVIVWAYLLIIFWGAYIVYVLEYDSIPYLDAAWMLVVTMTTLGYGDIVPNNFIGRVFVGIVSIIGIFIWALLISVIHEALQLTQQEKRILAYVENTDHATQKKNEAARCIQAAWKYYAFVRDNGEDIHSGKMGRVMRFRGKLYKVLEHWRTAKQPSDQWSKEFQTDNMAMQLTDVVRTINGIETNVNKIYSHFYKDQDSHSSNEVAMKMSDRDDHDPKNDDSKALALPAVQVVRPRPSSGTMNGQLPNKTPPQSPSDQFHGQIGNSRHLNAYGNTDVYRTASGSSSLSDPVGNNNSMTATDLLYKRIDGIEKNLDHIYFKTKSDIKEIHSLIQNISSPSSTPQSPQKPAFWVSEGKSMKSSNV